MGAIAIVFAIAPFMYNFVWTLRYTTRYRWVCRPEKPPYPFNPNLCQIVPIRHRSAWHVLLLGLQEYPYHIGGAMIIVGWEVVCLLVLRLIFVAAKIQDPE